MKKITIIILSVLLVLTLGALIAYYLLISGKTDSDGNPLTVRSFFPFGGENNPIVGNVSTSTEPNPNTEPENPTNFTKKLRKLSSEPVAGAGTLDTKAGTFVRYMAKATGHIYEIELFSPKEGRISNTTIPVVYDALWGDKNTSIIARYLKSDDQNVDTYYLNVKNISTTTEKTISGTAMPSNISDVTIFDNSVFYLIQGTNSSIGFIQNFDGSKKKQIWGSDIKELNSQFVNAKTISLTSKSAPNIPGFMYFINTDTGISRRVLGNIVGLSTLTDSSAENILYSEQNDTLRLYYYNVKTKASIGLTPATFPEKCVWSKKDKNIAYCAVPKTYLGSDSLTLWYQGKVSFSDDIWKFDTKNNTASIIEDLEGDSGTQIDVFKMSLSENEQYLVFTNKVDNILWSLDLLQ
jgi:hypothetical protein